MIVAATAFYIASQSGQGLEDKEGVVGNEELISSSDSSNGNNQRSQRRPLGGREELYLLNQRLTRRLEGIRNSRPVQEALRCYNLPAEPFGEGLEDLELDEIIVSEQQQRQSHKHLNAAINLRTRSTSMVSSSSTNPSLSEPPSNLPSCYSLDTATSFRADVRQEWINAVFGPDFDSPVAVESTSATTNKVTSSTRQGVGLAEIPSYVSYNISVPPGLNGDKLGITISRLPLGLYVRSVKPGTEAYCAGVKPNSVLVAINGMAMLAEPSRQALERIWQYEGLCDEMEDSKSLGSNSSTANSSGSGDPNSPIRIRDPVQMTFIHLGKLHSVVFLSNPPYGIEWSPCGNFALVKRSYGHGASIGVKRGSIVAGVNGNTLYDLDHTAAADELRQAFESNNGIELKLCFTPSAARTGHFERQLDNALPKRKPRRPKATAQHDGVEVRIHPVLWTRDQPHDASNSLAQLACRVAAGELYAPPRNLKFQPHQKVYRPCPPLSSLLRHWDDFDALIYCSRYHLSEYDDRMVKMPGAIQDALMHMLENDNATDLLETFLLQFISLACSQSSAPEDRDVRPDLKSMILQVAKSDINLVRQMELVVQSFEDNELLSGLAKLRLEMMDDTKQDGVITRRVEETTTSAIDSSDSDTTPTPSFPSNEQSNQIAQKEEERFTDPAVTESSSSVKGKTRRPRVLNFFRKKKKSNKRFQANKSNITREEATPPTIPKISVEQNATMTDADMETAMLSSQTPATIGLTYTSATSATNHETLVAGTEETTSQQISTVVPQQTDHELPDSDCSPFANTCSFIKDLEKVCVELEGSLLRSFSRKIAEWALQPWSASKGTALAQVTQAMRERLAKVDKHQPILNPIDTSEVLSSLDPKECYILPSAHFPWLLTFDCQAKTTDSAQQSSCESKQHRKVTRSATPFGQEKLYRTKVELIALRGASRSHRSSQQPGDPFRAFVVQGAVSGAKVESGRSIATDRSMSRHVWDKGNVLRFDSRSSWGPPQTLSFRVSEAAGLDENRTSAADGSKSLPGLKEEGFCWVDLSQCWDRVLESSCGETCNVSCHEQVWPLDIANDFDEHGELLAESISSSKKLELEVRVTTEIVDLFDPKNGCESPKRSLLYKRDDDLRQEMFAIQFINTCDSILKTCGLDLRVLTFRCIPVGKRRGFIEWVPGSVPLSQICQQPFGRSLLASKKNDPSIIPSDSSEDDESLSAVAKAGLTRFESLHRLGEEEPKSTRSRGSSIQSRNLIREFLRSVAYHPDHPYMIRKDVMDTYVKSCAGYCVITYLLGVGDRHLDNLLLHQSGHFFHCDYSFILGNDPKKYLPMRITEEMVEGMGGRNSDNFARFLSLACAAFLALRRSESVRHLLSLVRVMESSNLPDISENQSAEAAVLGVRQRLRLDLTQEKAISYMEKLIEDMLSNKMWIAVDAIHSLGKRLN